MSKLDSSPSKDYADEGDDSISVIYEPDDADVLFGRGAKMLNHPGNVRFRKLIKDWSRSYAGKHSGKTTIAKEVVNAVRSQRGRFLERKSGGEDGTIEFWTPVKRENVILDKIKQSFRDSLNSNANRNANTRTNGSQQTSVASIQHSFNIIPQRTANAMSNVPYMQQMPVSEAQQLHCEETLHDPYVDDIDENLRNSNQERLPLSRLQRQEILEQKLLEQNYIDMQRQSSSWNLGAACPDSAASILDSLNYQQHMLHSLQEQQQMMIIQQQHQQQQHQQQQQQHAYTRRYAAPSLPVQPPELALPGSNKLVVLPQANIVMSGANQTGSTGSVNCTSGFSPSHDNPMRDNIDNNDDKHVKQEEALLRL